MLVAFYFFLIFSNEFVHCIRIAFIQDAILIPRYLWNSTTVYDQTYQQCLCTSMPSFIAFNWFPNNTCELFYTFPVTYKIQSMPGARLYYPKGILPNASQCCMPDLNYLLNKLTTGTWTYVNITNPRNLLLDNNSYLVTVEIYPPYLDRFDAENLTPIDRTALSSDPSLAAMTVSYSNQAYFTGFQSGIIAVIDSENLTVLNSINPPYLQQPRSILFLNNARTMIVTSLGNNSIIFLNQTDGLSLNYTFIYRLSVDYSEPHGLTGHNDSFFYTTSYVNNSVHSYTATENSTVWIESLFIQAVSITSHTGGTFITIDECGRYWYSLDTYILDIFDSSGSWIGNFSLGSGIILDTLITDNYVMYLSNRDPSWNRIMRIDPHIQC